MDSIMRSRDLCYNESNVKFEVGWASVGWGVHYTANVSKYGNTKTIWVLVHTIAWEGGKRTPKVS